MRIWGYALLVIGILFLALFGLAELGGGHLGVLPFFVSVILILVGWKLGTAGKGILKTKPAAKADHSSAETATASGQAAAAAAESSTVEMPLTPEVAVLLERQNARAQRILLYVAGASLVFFAGMGVVLGATDKIPGEGRALLETLGAVGVSCAVAIYGISWLTTLKPVRKDLQGTSYLRTTGPVQVVPIMGGAMLRLADRAFLMNGRRGTAELSNLVWGKVDYSPHGHVVLGAWDREGRSVYCLPGYRVGSGANDV